MGELQPAKQLTQQPQTVRRQEEHASARGLDPAHTMLFSALTGLDRFGTSMQEDALGS